MLKLGIFTLGENTFYFHDHRHCETFKDYG